MARDDYHLAEASRLRDINGEPIGWHAGCPACGWFGPDRDTKAAAEEDARIHDETENS